MKNDELVYYKLSHPQKRIWYIDKISTNSPQHNIGGCLEINETIDVEVMKQTFNIIIKNNDGLRLRILDKDNEPIQYIQEFENEEIDFLDFSGYENPKDEFEIWAEQVFKRSFNLEESQLYYFAVYKISDKKYGVLVNTHHIISDGWTTTLIEKQICEIYSSLINNGEFHGSKNSSYIDFINEEREYLRSDRFIKNRDFWKRELENMPKEFLYKTSNSLEGKRQVFDINNELSQQIKKFADNKKCSLNTFFISILLIYIYKITYKKDIVIGTPVFNRSGKDQKNMIGMFTSTMPFRFNLNTESNIEQLIKLVNRQFKLCLVNQKYPYDLLMKDLEISKEGYDSLFKMSVNYYNSEYDNQINDIDVNVKEYYCGNQSYSLQLTVKEWEEGKITLNFDYKTIEYSKIQIKTMYKSMINIIKQIVEDEAIVINKIKLVDEEENKYKVYDLNSTTSYYPKKTVYELFEEQVNKTPNNIALEFNEQKLTYKELNEKANQLANHLKEKNIGRESIVAIMETHSIELMISILGVIKTGAAYLPIDPSYPIERIKYMLENSKAKILIINFDIKEKIKFEGNIINIKNIDFNRYSKLNLMKANNLNDLVYIIYTSGSTGKPKGVMIEHKGLTNYIWWANKMYLKDENEVMALYSSISFDLTVTSIFTPLVAGHKIVIYGNDEKEFVLYKIFRENRATVLKLTPAHLTLLKDIDNRNLVIKRLIVGGEDLKVAVAKNIYNSFGKNVEILNEYGPTETVVGCMLYKYDDEKDNGTSVPIGYPADNVQVYILDKELNTVPTGYEGELYISGDGVARGYLNREELTVDRFLENPFIEGNRMYKTGDIAIQLKNGSIEYIGRRDNQTKIRGHRIEIGEIERYLLENKSIKDAVVVVKEDLLENKQLNAYLVTKDEITDSELRQWLIRFLPKYMIPSNFIFIDKLPLTLNGKVNYDLLPDPIIEEREVVKYKTLAEKELVKAIEEIIGVGNISMNDNYYRLGGDSIKAIQISSKLKNSGLKIKVEDILSYDSIQEIAATIEEDEEIRTINQDKCEGIIEPTPIMKWFFSQKFTNKNFYNQNVLLEYKGNLDINKVEIAINKLIEYHDALRINYDKNKNKFYYNNKHLKNRLLVKYIDVSDLSYNEQSYNIKQLVDQVNKGLDIENSLLFNLSMINMGQENQALLFTAHHLIVDGVSWRIILGDFVSILNQLDKNEDIILPMKTNSFKEWSDALQEYSKNDFNEELHYWESILNKRVTHNVDSDEAEIVVGSINVLTEEIQEVELTNLVNKMNEIYNMELNEVLITALVLTINKLTDKEDIIIELERHGRENINEYIDIARTVGWFTSMYPAYFKVVQKNLGENIKILKEQIRNIPNKGFDYSVLKFLTNEIKKYENKYVRFNYLGDLDNIIDKEVLDLTNIQFDLNSDKDNALTSLIDVVAMIVDKKLKIKVEYSQKRFKDEMMKNFIECYVDTLKLILDECIDKNEKEFTPSDFDTIDIAQEDLDVIFN